MTSIQKRAIALFSAVAGVGLVVAAFKYSARLTGLSMVLAGSLAASSLWTFTKEKALLDFF